jgi:uncharacterized membrane protein HdeD (DUF308 family)
MPRATVVFGILLILLGVWGYFGESTGLETSAAISGSEQTTTDIAASNPSNGKTSKGKTSKTRSVTALIPAVVGAILLVCGLLSFNEKRRMHVMHVAVLAGLLGALAGIGRGAMGFGQFLSSDPDLNRRAFLFVWGMAILCTVFVVLCVRSFVQARQQRDRQEHAAE